MYSEQEGSNRHEPANNGDSRDLYAATSPSTRAAAARPARLRLLTVTSGECGGVIGLKAGEGRIEHFPARHKDDIQPRRRFLFSEQLAGETLGPIPHHGGAEFSSGGDPEARPLAAVGRHEEGHEPARQPQAVLVRLLEFWAPSDAFVPGKALRHRALAALLFVGDGEPFSTLRPAAFQHDAAVLRRHAYEKAVGLAAAPSVGLKRPFTLCHGDCVLHELSETPRVKLPILAVAQSMCQKNGVRIAVCYSARASFLACPCRVVTALRSVSPPRFPHLWKTLWKSR